MHTLTEEHLDEVLALHRRLIEDGMDADLAQMKAAQAVGDLRTRSVDDVRSRILESTDPRWLNGGTPSGEEEEDGGSRGDGNVFERIRAEAEERKADEENPSVEERLGMGGRS